MKIEVNGKDCYRIFINREYLSSICLDEKSSITDVVKETLLKLKNRLNLRGFYKVKVFPHRKLGLFLELTQLEDLEFSNNLDLRVVIYFGEKFYFGTDDYFRIEKYEDIRYFDGKFYCLIDEDFDDILSLIEFGDIIYGEEVINLLNNSVVL